MSNDTIHRFSFANAPIRGQWVRLSGTLTDAFQCQSYPAPAQKLLAEMLAAVSLMADGIKLGGSVALQARGDGPVGTVLAECRERRLLRGIVRWRDDAAPHGAPHGKSIEAGVPGGEPSLSALLGQGQMVITLTPDVSGSQHGNAYQGVVALSDDSLVRNLESYFANSEQLPTRLFMAFEHDAVTGLLLQRLPVTDLATELTLDLRDEAWSEVAMLADTVRADELAGLTLNALLRRLFSEHLITVHPARQLEFSCTCTRERVERMLRALPRAEILELLETRGSVDVTCEICGRSYGFDRVDTHLLYEAASQRTH